MIRKVVLGSVAFLAFTVTYAQKSAPSNPQPCGINKQKDKIFEDFKQYETQDSLDQAEFQKYYEEYLKTYSPGDRAAYIIPVVVHIVHLNGSENISDAQVYDGLRVLNEDFQMQNADVSQVVSSFQGIIGNADIEFRLATKDPNGNCHKGITRTYSSNTYDTGMDFSGHPIVEDVRAEHGTWPQNKYLNIFLCIDPDGAAGYTMTPANWLPANDMYGGILLRHDYMGSIGTGNYSLARSLSHEVGHWLNLSHTWGDNNNPGNSGSCSDDDGVNDTPNTIGWTTCNTSGTTCNSLDNVQNFMEYSYCSRMFSQGQVARMHAALNNSTAGRDNLWTTSNLNATGASNLNPGLCEADFEGDRVVVCAGDSIEFTDLSYHGVTSWSWDFTGGTPSSSTAQSPGYVTYNTPGTYTVTLTAGDGTITDTETKTAYITILPADALPVPHFEGFESLSAFPGSDFTIENPDSDGTWELSTVVGSGGSKSAYIQNSSSDAGKTDAFISNTFDLTGLNDVVLAFDHAYAQRISTNVDKLSIYVSRDCGKSWSVRKNLSGTNLSTVGTTTSNFVPAYDDWTTTSITNITSTYLVSGFRYKFEFTSDGGNNIYIDNINLMDPLGVPVDPIRYGMNIYPNPSDDETFISFDIPNPKEVNLYITDLTGRTIDKIFNGSVSGYQTVSYNSTQLSAGVYVVQLQVGDQLTSKKLVIK